MKHSVPDPFQNAVRGLSSLPGIGEKTAERLVFHILNQSRDARKRLAESILALNDGVRECSICHHISVADTCTICSDERRDESRVCVVELAQDVVKLENCIDYTGRYHVLGGRYAPLDGIFPEDLHLDSLVRRVKRGAVAEVILATSCTTEGEATSQLVQTRLQGLDIRISRLATGLPQGSEIQWAGPGALQDAFAYRREVLI